MEVVSRSPLPVASRVWQARPGAYVLTFVCKATFTLAPGELELAPEQDPVDEADRPWGGNIASLYAASDLVPGKPRADVVLVGSAYAPEGAQAARVVARLAVAEIDKSIDVYADRTIDPKGAIQEGPPFTQIPLLYERAAGGPGTANPVGISSERGAYGVVALPNLTAPGARVGGREPLQPVGFGPIAATWPLRTARLGVHAQGWVPDQWHARPLPPGFDMAYFNVAPPDQQPATLKGNERLVLENLNSEHPRLVMTLPALRLSAKLETVGATRAIPLTCDTLWIDTRRAVCSLVYRGTVALNTPADPGWVIVTLDQPPPSQVSGEATVDSGTASDLAISVGPDGNAKVSRAMTLPFASFPRDAAPSRADALPFRPMGAPSSLRASELPASRPPPSATPPAPTRGAPPPPPVLAPPVVQSATVPPPAVAAPPAVAMQAPPLQGSPWVQRSQPSGFAAQDSPVVPPGEFRAVVGVAAASNAAAVASVAVARAQEGPRAVAAPLASPLVRAAPREPMDLVELVYFDADAMPRIRRVPAWKKILADLDDRPLESDEDDPAAAKEPGEVEDRREIIELLMKAERSDAGAVDDAVGRAIRDDGRFTPPIVLVAGELLTPFDEVEMLRATVTSVAPLVGNDEALRASVDVAQDFLRLPPPLSSSAAEGLTTRLRDGFNQGKRTVQAGYLDQVTERGLLEQRAYQRRPVLGAKRIRTTFQFASGAAMVAYLPDDAAPHLPLYPRFKLRMIARVHLPLDRHEASPLALEALAIARLTPAPRRFS